MPQASDATTTARNGLEASPHRLFRSQTGPDANDGLSGQHQTLECERNRRVTGRSFAQEKATASTQIVAPGEGQKISGRDGAAQREDSGQNIYPISTCGGQGAQLTVCT